MNTSGGNAVLDNLITKIESQLIDPAITLLTLAAFVLFVWGVVEYIQGAANEEKRATGQRHVLWGIVGLVIMFGAIAIVNILKNITGAFS